VVSLSALLFHAASSSLARNSKAFEIRHLAEVATRAILSLAGGSIPIGVFDLQPARDTKMVLSPYDVRQITEECIGCGCFELPRTQRRKQRVINRLDHSLGSTLTGAGNFAPPNPLLDEGLS
jgi:hypothetical protein